MPLQLELSLVLTGLGVTTLLGFAAGPFMRWISRKIDISPPKEWSEDQQKAWREVICETEGGAILGWFERSIFVAILMAEPSASSVIAGWLGFKVASKWKIWEYLLPEPKEMDNVAPAELLAARRRRNSHVLMTFLIGTAYNLAAGLAGTIAAPFGKHVFAFIARIFG
jgi:hypothetical protein